jgi:hypothetical protein
MSKYVRTDAQCQRINNNFVYHAPKDGQQERYVSLRDKARELAIHIEENTPPSREQSLAVTNLEDAIFWANAAIARNE